MSQKDLEAELLKALMVTYATGMIIAADLNGAVISDEDLARRIKVVKEALS